MMITLIINTIALTISIIHFIPQCIQVVRERENKISLRTLSTGTQYFIIINSISWITLGYYYSSWIVALPSFMSIPLAIIIIIIKKKKLKEKIFLNNRETAYIIIMIVSIINLIIALTNIQNNILDKNIIITNILATSTSFIMLIPQFINTFKNKNNYIALRAISYHTHLLTLINAFLWVYIAFETEVYATLVASTINIPLSILTIIYIHKAKKHYHSNIIDKSHH